MFANTKSNEQNLTDCPSLKVIDEKNDKDLKDEIQIMPDCNWDNMSKSFKFYVSHSSLYKDCDQISCLIRNNLGKIFGKSMKSLQQKADENKIGIELQLEESTRKLQSLSSFGSELVANIKCANEKREILRSQYVFSRRQALQLGLKNESIESLACFEDIASKWSEFKILKEPIHVSEKMREQGLLIEDILNQKDYIISQCQKEIHFLSDIYCTDKEKNSDDVNTLIERIDSQTELLKETYNENFGFLYNNIQNERLNMEFSVSIKWKSFYDEMLKNEKTKFYIVKEKEKFYAREISRICAEQESTTRGSRIRLAKDTENLQRELLKSKNLVLMASEKLDYNYQVLQKRNEENVIINNQQKRRVARLNEGISALKKKIRDSELNTQIFISKLVCDIKKLHLKISALEQKSEQFRDKNETKYNNIYDISLQQIQSILQKVFKINKVVHQQQLVIPWREPEIDFPIYISKPVKKQVRRTGKNHGSIFNIEEYESNTLRSILGKLSDRAGFLVEENLLHILQAFEEEEKSLARLDNIFAALRINDIKIISKLVKFFEPYCWCPNCSIRLRPGVLNNMFVTENYSNKTDIQKIVMVKGVEEIKNNGTKKNEFCANHYLVIESALVITALKEFTKQHAIEKKLKRSAVGEIDVKPINKTTYKDLTRNAWLKLNSFVPEDNLTLWLSLVHGLTHYLDVLRNREGLDRDCKFLRQQNSEFLHMFQKFN